MCDSEKNESDSNKAEETTFCVKPFARILEDAGIELKREKTTILQLNTGLLCNQMCKHCHLNAGPGRPEIMNRKTIDQIVNFAAVNHFEMIDITGGAPEMNPELSYMIGQLSGLAPTLILRCNLTVLHDFDAEKRIREFSREGVTITASFPSLNEKQADAQRGHGIYKKSIEMLKLLNQQGYGMEGAGLELNLVSNPSGAFMPTSQREAEKRFRQVLLSKWGIHFTHLYNFANVPLGRFKNWLKKSENYRPYMEKLAASFNPSAVSGLMCRNLMSVSWDGYVYDCDFNLADGIPMGGKKTHITELSTPPARGLDISVADHCYACTAGAGFT